jgi:outer membrane biogenesis lipoprotein LolB
MKRFNKYAYLLFLLSLLLSSCSPSTISVQTAIAETQLAQSSLTPINTFTQYQQTLQL